MAKRKIDESVAEKILEILLPEKDGLEIPVIHGRLENLELSDRSLRNLLTEMERKKSVVKNRVYDRQKAGAPKFIYVHESNTPQQQSLFDLIPGIGDVKIETRSRIESRQLSEEEQERRAYGVSVLERIATSHISEDGFAEAIINIAPQLAEENPISLILEMAEWVVKDLNASGSAYVKLCKKDIKAADDAARKLDSQLTWARRFFQKLLRFDRSIDKTFIVPIMEIPMAAKKYQSDEKAILNRAEAESILNKRVKGDKVLEIIETEDSYNEAVGTDASVADFQLKHNRGSFVPPSSVSIMCSAAALKRRSDGATHEYHDFEIFPDALDKYKEYEAAVNGLVLSTALRHELGQGDLKHTRSAAMDLRQYEQDKRVVLKDAVWRPFGDAPRAGIVHKPKIIFRDGRIFPLVHRLSDFEKDGLYGEIVRREIEAFAVTVGNVFLGISTEVTYGACVKSPSMPWLSPIVFWYLHREKIRNRKGNPLVNSEDVYRHVFPDPAVSHLLFLGMAKQMKELKSGCTFVTFRLLRRFSDIAMSENLPPIIENPSSIRKVDEDDEDDWKLFIKQRLKKQTDDRKEFVLDDEDVYRTFISVCARAAVSMVYTAPCQNYKPLVEEDGSGAHFLIPRTEVIVDTREPNREFKNLKVLLSWLATGGCELDLGHTQEAFASGYSESKIPVLVPDVVLAAHEAATFARTRLGQEVEDDLLKRVAKLERLMKNKKI